MVEWSKIALLLEVYHKSVGDFPDIFDAVRKELISINDAFSTKQTSTPVPDSEELELDLKGRRL